MTRTDVRNAVAAPETIEEILSDELTASLTPWNAIVWNDPVNLMSYVTYVFKSYFGYSEQKAHRLMLEVHNDGRSIVATGGREEMERHVEAMHGYGLWATLERADK
jgi:ATP-dependent Clp protease adaptor protein ClpS